MKNAFSRFESFAQAVIEERFVGLFRLIMSPDIRRRRVQISPASRIEDVAEGTKSLSPTRVQSIDSLEILEEAGGFLIIQGRRKQ